METDHQGGLPALFEQAQKLAEFEVVMPQQIVAVPEGKTLQSLKPLLDQYLTRPERRVGVQKVDRLESFVEWVNRHKDSGSALFCEAYRDAPRLCAVIDYHESGAVEKVDDQVARWGKFGASYPMPLDPRWLAWRKADGVTMSQAEFAGFLQDRALDLCPFAARVEAATPELLALPPDVQDFLNLTGGKCGTPEEIMLLAKGLDIAVEATSVERVRLESGEVKLAFEEKHNTSVAVPSIFLIALPVFALSDRFYRLPVRLRYRVDQGKTFWTPLLWRADETLDKAIQDNAEKAKTDTGLPMFYGTGPLR